MATEQELKDKAARTIELQASAPKCECACGCQYVLGSSISREHGRCFGCRAKVHYGGTPLAEEDPE